MKFKKSVSFFIAILLLVCNTGFALTVHFCEGKIASISSAISSDEICEKPAAVNETACCIKSSPDHEACCSDNVIDLQDNTDDVVVKSFSFQIDIPFVFQDWKPTDFSGVMAIPVSNKLFYYCDAHSPPLFKLYSQYIFYA